MTLTIPLSNVETEEDSPDTASPPDHAQPPTSEENRITQLDEDSFAQDEYGGFGDTDGMILDGQGSNTTPVGEQDGNSTFPNSDVQSLPLHTTSIPDGDDDSLSDLDTQPVHEDEYDIRGDDSMMDYDGGKDGFTDDCEEDESHHSWDDSHSGTKLPVSSC